MIWFIAYYRKKGKRIGKEIPRKVDLSSIILLNKCQLCGQKHSLKRYKGLLIHHKDNDPKNNKLTNLMLLCRGCHNRVHKSKKKII